MLDRILLGTSAPSCCLLLHAFGTAFGVPEFGTCRKSTAVDKGAARIESSNQDFMYCIELVMLRDVSVKSQQVFVQRSLSISLKRDKRNPNRLVDRDWSITHSRELPTSRPNTFSDCQHTLHWGPLPNCGDVSTLFPHPPRNAEIVAVTLAGKTQPQPLPLSASQDRERERKGPPSVPKIQYPSCPLY